LTEAVNSAEQKARTEAEQCATIEARLQELTDAVNTAEHKAQAEANARAEAEQIAKAESARRTRAEARIQELMKAIAAAEQRLTLEANVRAQAEIQKEREARQKMEMPTDRIGPLKDTPDTQARRTMEPERPPIEIVSIPTTAAACECCGRENIQQGQAVRLDSGQVFCQDCFRTLSGSSLV
jgi:fused signal recognition particle receptor